jgi:hypothetical protein
MRRAVILGSILALAGMIFFVIAGYEALGHGSGSYKTTATITGKHVFHASSGDAYYVDFRYTDRGGGPHKMSASASQSEYARAKDGDAITVSVAANDPSDASLVAENSSGHIGALLIAVAGAACFIPGAWLLARNLWKGARLADSEIR